MRFYFFIILFSLLFTLFTNQKAWADDQDSNSLIKVLSQQNEKLLETIEKNNKVIREQLSKSTSAGTITQVEEEKHTPVYAQKRFRLGAGMNLLRMYSNTQAYEEDKKSNHNQVGLNLGARLYGPMWFEARYGRNVIRDAPSVGLDTAVEVLDARMKYDFGLTNNFVVSGIAGYRRYMADSDGAGNDNYFLTQYEIQRENDYLQSIRDQSATYLGVELTFLIKTWFVQAEVTTDSMGASMGVYF